MINCMTLRTCIFNLILYKNIHDDCFKEVTDKLWHERGPRAAAHVTDN